MHFTDRVLRMDCREVTSVYPSNILARVIVEPRQVLSTDCRLLREPYCGQESLVLANGLLRARLLPKLGGRLIELNTLPDETPHLYADPALIKQGAGTSWADFGGMEEDAGGWPGSYWNANFAVTVVEETLERFVVRLAMEQPVEWAYGYAHPKSGRIRLVKEITLRRGESRLQFDPQAFNEAQAAMPVGLRTHPLFRIGGDGGPGDHWLLRLGGQIVDKPYPFPGAFPAEGDWTALVDQPKHMALIQGHDPAVVETLYAHAPPGLYGLELWARVREMAPGEALPFSHSLSLLQGLSGLDACRDGLAVHIDTGETVAAGKDEVLPIGVEVGCIRAAQGALALEMWQGDRRIASLGEAAVNLQRGLAVTRGLKWQRASLPDGNHGLLARFTPTGGVPLEARRTVMLSRVARQQQLQGLAAYGQQIEALKQAYLRARKAGEPAARLAARRERAVAATLLLAELGELVGAGRTEESPAVAHRLKGTLATPAK